MIKLLTDFKTSFPVDTQQPAAPAQPMQGGGIKQEEGESVMEYLRRYQRLMGTSALPGGGGGGGETPQPQGGKKPSKAGSKGGAPICEQFMTLGTCFLGDKCENRHPLKQ
jgi:hypothetical protein